MGARCRIKIKELSESKLSSRTTKGSYKRGGVIKIHNQGNDKLGEMDDFFFGKRQDFL